MVYFKDVFINLSLVKGILIRIFLIGLFISLYDVLLHTLFVGLHLTFEWVEYMLEEIIEHTFHTNRKQSQLVVFYLLWLIGFYGLYRLMIILYRVYESLKNQLSDRRCYYQAYISQQLTVLTANQKIKWTTALMASVFFVVIFNLM
jgi:type VI protein secretion system component VasF